MAWVIVLAVSVFISLSLRFHYRSFNCNTHDENTIVYHSYCIAKEKTAYWCLQECVIKEKEGKGEYPVCCVGQCSWCVELSSSQEHNIVLVALLYHFLMIICFIAKINSKSYFS